MKLLQPRSHLFPRLKRLPIGATPIYVDIDPKTYNLDPEKLESVISDRTAMFP